VNHRLVGAAADGDEAGVHERAARGAFLHVPEAAVELDAFVGDGAAGASAEELAHRDLERRVLVAHALADAFVSQLSRRGDLREHLDELEFRHLHVDQAAAEKLSLLAVLPRLFPEDLRSGIGGDAGDQSLVLELLIERDELYGLQLVASSKRRLKRGTVYVTLGRMEDKGYITSRLEAAPADVGGMPRRL